MASKPARFGATVVDALGVKTNVVSYLQIAEAQTLTQVAAALATWVSAVEACVSGGVVATHVSLPAPVPGGATSPSPDSRSYETVVLNLRNADNTYSWAQVIPAFDDALLTAGKPDPTGGPLAALVTLLTTGGGAIEYSTPDGAPLVSLNDAFLSVRKHRRQLRNKSFAIG